MEDWATNGFYNIIQKKDQNDTSNKESIYDEIMNKEKNINLSTQIDSSKEEVESLENTIGEIQSGYDNLLETGDPLSPETLKRMDIKGKKLISIDLD